LIGAFTTTGGGYGFNGTLDELRIYNRALTPSEVEGLYNYAPGPVGHWKFDEGSGTSVTDSSGNANTGTWYGGGNHWVPGKFGKAGGFNGSNDWVTPASYTGVPTGNQSYTMSAWVNVTSLPNAVNRVIVGCGRYGFTNQDNALKLTYEGGQYKIYNYWWGNDLSANISNPSGSWHHIAATYDGVTRRIFLDGVQKSSDSPSAHNVQNVSYFRIGNDGGGGSVFSGSIDDVKIYNYARSADQIREDMLGRTDSGVSLQGVTASGKGTVGYWAFNEGSGTTAKDGSGNGNNGTITGAMWNQNGKFGRALQFDGVNDQVTLPLAMTAMPLTIEMWVNPASSSPVGIFDSASGQPDVLRNYSAGYVEWWNATPRVTLNLTASVWQHVIFVFKHNGTDRIIDYYKNGVLQTSASGVGSSTYAWTTFRLGNINGGTNGWYSGLIDEVKIYNYALTSDEIKTEYNAGSALKLGSLGSNSSYSPDSSNQLYCVPGSTDSCAAPVAEWNFEEGSGTSVADSSGNGNTGTWSGTGNHWVAGKQGKAGGFNGTSDYVSVANASSLNVTTTFTFSTWIKKAVVNHVNMYVFLKGNIILYLVLTGDSSYSNKVGFYIGGTDIYTLGTPINDTNWHYVTWVYEGGSSMRTYVDGVLNYNFTSSVPASATPGTGSLYLSSNGTNQFINGRIDNTKLFNYARTPAQIAWDYNQGDPIARWKMDECTGTSIKDSSGNGNTGTLTNATAGTCDDGTGTTAWSAGKTGKFNSSLKFDGTDDYVSIPDNAYLRFTSGTFAISAWVKTNDNAGIIVSKIPNAPPYAGWEYCISQGQAAASPGKPSFWNGADWVSANTRVDDGTWHHILVVYNGTNVNFYLDGKADGSSSRSNPNSSTEAVIVGMRAGTYGGLSGQIDDVQIFNYALTAAQVKTLFNENAVVRFGN
jgi:hypothetical protein